MTNKNNFLLRFGEKHKQLLKQLKHLSTDQDIPVYKLIIEAIEQYLKKR